MRQWQLKPEFRLLVDINTDLLKTFMEEVEVPDQPPSVWEQVCGRLYEAGLAAARGVGLLWFALIDGGREGWRRASEHWKD